MSLIPTLVQELLKIFFGGLKAHPPGGIGSRPFSTGLNFPRGATFLFFKDQLAESGRQKTKENIIPRGKFRLVENGP